MHILFIALVYIGIDAILIDYIDDNNAFSKGFYAKFILVLLYLIASKEKPIMVEQFKPIDAAFHFSIMWLALWMGAASMLMNNVALSKAVGVFLIFGALGAFSLIDETLIFARRVIVKNMFGLILLEICLKVLLFSIFVWAAFFIFAGEWIWDVKQFYEW